MVRWRGAVVAIALAATGLPSLLDAAPPGRMSAAEFLARAEERLVKGPSAPFPRASDRLTVEMQTTFQGYLADLERAGASGRGDLGCYRPEHENGVTMNEWLAAIRAMPVARRRTTTAKAVFYRLMRTRFPC